jgi:hypothetical protein
MAKFGVMAQNGKEVFQEFEGDWLEINGDIVCVMVKKPASTDGQAMNVVRLAPGFVVKQIT